MSARFFAEPPPGRPGLAVFLNAGDPPLDVLRELVLRLAIRSKGKETQHEVAERQSVAVDGYTVTVLEALPARGPEAHRIAPADYSVTIKVTRAKSQ